MFVDGWRTGRQNRIEKEMKAQEPRQIHCAKCIELFFTSLTLLVWVVDMVDVGRRMKGDFFLLNVELYVTFYLAYTVSFFASTLLTYRVT